MGTTYAITVPAPAEPDLEASITGLLARINDSMSTYLPESTISRVNAGAGETWHGIDPHFEAVFRRSKEIHEDTGGRFDPAVGPLVDAWGFGPGGPSTIPDPARLSALAALADFDLFEIGGDPPSVRKALPEAALDFNAIAKGYAVDEVGRLLEGRGVADYFVEIGGEVRTRGEHPDRRAWRIGIEVPSSPQRPRAALVSIEVEDAAMATSGDYRNVIEDGGRQFTHIFDPATGKPETTSLVSVSVLAPDVMTADAYATALMLMGVDAGLRFVEARPELEAYFIVDAGDGSFTMAPSSGFPERVE